MAPFTLPSVSLPLPFLLSSLVGCFKENKIYGSGSKSCFFCAGASRCMLLSGLALPSHCCPAPSLLTLYQRQLTFPLTNCSSCATAPSSVEHSLSSARYSQLPASCTSLSDKLPLVSTLGKAWISSLLWDKAVNDVNFLCVNEQEEKGGTPCFLQPLFLPQRATKVSCFWGCQKSFCQDFWTCSGPLSPSNNCRKQVLPCPPPSFLLQTLLHLCLPHFLPVSHCRAFGLLYPCQW